MAALKLYVLVLFFSLVSTGIGVDGDASIPDVQEGQRSDGSDSTVLEQLKSKIHSLEQHVEEKTREIKDRDMVIATREKIIKEKSDSIMSLESDIASLKEKSDASEEVEKAYARAGELEKQVEELQRDLDVKIKEQKKLRSHLTEADKKSSELNSKVDSLQKISDDQKTKLHKTERALRIAEEEMMKTKFEAASKNKELMESQDAWLPPWLAVHFIHYQSLLKKNWEVHGKPAVELLMQKAIEKKVHVEEWAAPHVETMKIKWLPAIKEQCVVIASNVEPQVQAITMKTIEIYETSKKAVAPHVTKALELAYPYFQELRKVSKPYIDEVATAARPHVDILRDALEPYTQQAVHTYRKFLESASTYHHHVQDTVQEKLNSHDLTKPLATKELVWFAASTLLALPGIFLMKICSAVFCKQSQKPMQNGNYNHSRRKAKRRHVNK